MNKCIFAECENRTSGERREVAVDGRRIMAGVCDDHARAIDNGDSSGLALGHAGVPAMFQPDEEKGGW